MGVWPAATSRTVVGADILSFIYDRCSSGGSGVIGWRCSEIVNVPLVLGDRHEAVPLIESVCRAVPQGAEANRHPAGVGLGQEVPEDSRANPAGLAARIEIK